MRVLVVEDDPTVGELLTRVLREEGIDSVLCTTAESGLGAAREPYDAIVLDWMLPDGNGPSFCVSLRDAAISTPVVMLTARGEVSDRVLGLRSGADDYLVKPFDVEELLARLKALVRRNRGFARIAAGPLVIDRVERRCFLQGEPLELTAREYGLLLRLAQEEGAPVSRTVLLQDVWGMTFDPGSGLLDVQVSRLRDKLGKYAPRIETVRGLGYRLKSDA